MMKALWLREVQAILQRDEARAWWEFIEQAERKLDDFRARQDELLAQERLMAFRAELTQKKAIDTLYQAGEYEDQGAQMEAEASEIENKSYEAVGNFETQRIAVSDLFSRMGACEHGYLGRLAEVRSLEAAQAGAKDPARKEELGRQTKRKEAECSRAEKEFRDASASYERENNLKIRLWEEVEQMWVRSMDIALGAAERRMHSHVARLAAERLFRESEQYKQRAEGLRQEADDANRKREELARGIEEHRAKARDLLGCLVGEDFLYWPQRENNKLVYCTPIRNLPSGFNIELRAKSLYQVSRQRGVEFIEPLPPVGTPSPEKDRRIDDFFGSSKNE